MSLMSSRSTLDQAPVQEPYVLIDCNIDRIIEVVGILKFKNMLWG